MSEATPRINATQLEQFQSRTVRILGRVLDLRGDSAVVDAGGQITVLLSRDAHLVKDHAFEVVGKVNSDLRVRMLGANDFGAAASLNMKAVEAVVDATHRYPELFQERM